jgi:tRNA A37 methylthiotransferase MiaB
MRPGLIQVIAAHPNIASYFDLSFQHASNPVLRRMRRFGDTEAFLDLIAQIRAIAPTAGIRSNVIVGFPGETEADLAELQRFLEAAQLDAIGVFGYSDEDETEAATLPDKIDPAVISQRVSRITDLANELMEQRAEARIGETAEVIVESIEPSAEGWIAEGHAGHQGPDDGTTYVRGTGVAPAIGDIIAVTISGTEGIDLRAEYAL